MSDGGAEGNRTPDQLAATADTSATESAQNCAKTKHSNAFPDPARTGQEQKPTLSGHPLDTSLHQKYVPSMHQNLPEDLAQVVESWSRLHDTVKAAILAKVQAADR